MTAVPDPSASAWIAGRDGLLPVAEGLLARLPELLDEAHRRAERILGSSPADPRSIGRLVRLAGIAAPDLLPVLRDRRAETIVPVLAKLALRGGPTYVKLGQLIASTKGIAPPWVAEPFEGCRDAVPPAPRDQIAEVVRRSGVEAEIASWERTPMASASVAQVHAATLVDGTDVVMKIRRPGIVATVSSDAAYLLPLLRLVESRNERLKPADLPGLLELMIRLFAQEADLRLESANLIEIALAFERAAVTVEIPRPIPGLVTKRVMVMERVDGVSAAVNGEAIEDLGHRGVDLVRLAVTGTLRTTMVDGVFHGDLHLGNVLITKSGLALIDFGIVGRLSDGQRRAIARLLGAALAEDRDSIIRALVDFGALPPGANVDRFLDALPRELTREERRKLMGSPDARHQMEERFMAIVRALSAAGFKVPPELTLFAKNLVYLGDAVLRHAPEVDLAMELGQAVTSVFAHMASTD